MAMHRNQPPSRSGHVAVCYKDCVYIWAGYEEGHNEDHNHYFTADELWIYDGVTETWSTKKCSAENCPTGVSGSTATVIDEYMYVFGGYYQNPEGTGNQLFRLDLEEYQWEHLRPVGRAPIRVDKTVSWENNGKFYTFGGFGSPTSLNSFNVEFGFVFDHVMWRGWTNQFYEYDPEKNTWAVPSYEGDLPLPRAAHAAASMKKKVYIFGGRHDRRRMNDLHCCDMTKEVFKWSTCVPAEGPVPEGRSWHSLTAISDHHLLLYGGFSNDNHPLADCWSFNTKTSQWILLQLSFHEHRLWHTASLTYYNEVMIFGGCSSNILDPERRPDQADEIIFIRLSPKSLYRICLDRVGELQELCSEWCNLPHNVQAILNLRYCTTRATSLDGS